MVLQIWRNRFVRGASRATNIFALVTLGVCLSSCGGQSSIQTTTASVTNPVQTQAPGPQPPILPQVHGDYVPNYSFMWGTAYRGIIVYDSSHHYIFASSPDMNRVDVLSSDTHQVLTSIPVPAPTGLDLSLDSKLLLVGSKAEQAEIIDTSSLRVINRVRTALPNDVLPWTARLVAWTSVGTALLVGNTIRVWTPANGTLNEHQLPGFPGFQQIARTGDGSRVILGDASSGGKLAIYDAATDSFPFATGATYFSNYVLGLVANKDGSQYGTVLFDSETGNQWLIFLDSSLHETQRFAFNAGFSDMVFDPSRRYLSIVSPPAIQTIDTTSMQIVRVAPSLATNIAYIERAPSLFFEIPITEDDNGILIGIGDHGIVFDDSNNSWPGVDALAPLVWFIVSNPAEGPLGGGNDVQLLTQSFPQVPNVWFGNKRATDLSIGAPYLSATAPATASLRCR